MLKGKKEVENLSVLDMDWLGGKVVSVIGLVKNAGKTTCLNALLARIYAEGRLACPALTSVGRDGESTDVVTGTHKPGIFIREGTLVATAEKLLAYGDFTREFLLSTGVSTPLGEVFVLRARSGGVVQLGGPSMTEQLKTLNRQFFDLGADCVLIDGAAGRRSLGAASVADGAVLCSGASLDRSMEKVAEETAFIAGLMQLPLLEAGEEALDLPGAVTDSVLAELIKQGRALTGRTLAADDPSKLLFSQANYARLLRLGARLCLKERPRLLAVAVNPVSARGWRFDAGAFRRSVALRVDVPVIDVMEGGI